MSRLITIIPARALVHPLWLSCLALLVLNDHVLKGSARLPDLVTGKLSDLVGLVVAPTLLATMARVRTRGGWTAAHVVVGLGFAAIQLSPAYAAYWSAGMDALGFRWRITMDPTDLFALPMLALSWWGFGTAIVRADAARPRRTLERVLAAIGLLCCAATSRGETNVFVPGDVFVHNGSDRDVVIRVREPRTDVEIDCARVADDPGRLLTEVLFGDAQSWTVSPGVNHVLIREPLVCESTEDGFCDEPWWCATGTDWVDCEGEPPIERRERDCRIVLLDTDGIAPAIVFWSRDAYEIREIEREEFDPDAEGGFRIELDADGGGRYTHGDGLVFALVTAPPAADSCAPQGDDDRLQWSSAPYGVWTITDVVAGLDDCWAIDLAPIDGDANRQRWYVCVPLDDLPFLVDDEVRILPASTPAGADGVILKREANDAVELHLLRGESIDGIAGLRISTVAESACGLAADPVCGTVARAVDVLVEGGAAAATLRRGESIRLDDPEAGTIDLHLVHAQDRIIVDPLCAEGPDTLGDDLEIVVLVQR